MSLPGPESGLLSNARRGIVRGDTRADKAKDFIGKGRPGGEQQGEGPQETCSATWLTASGFVVMGLVSGLSLANHLAWPIFGLTQGPSWWCVHPSAKMHSGEEDSGRLVGRPFGPCRILPVSFRAAALRSLLGPPVVRQLRQAVISMPGQGLSQRFLDRTFQRSHS